MKRGRGLLIVLPRFKSNEEIIETFLHRVVPRIYPPATRIGLIDKYSSPAEKSAQTEVANCQTAILEIEHRLAEARTLVAGAKREKANILNADPTAKQILAYYDAAMRQDDVALFYLYKTTELIENKFGGETDGINSLGLGTEWKFVKKTANVSYGDMRHAPRPGDVIKKWSNTEIKACFDATEKIILAYFATLFTPDTEKRAGRSAAAPGTQP